MLFDAAHIRATAAALVNAISLSAIVPAAAVSIRRVRDMSDPATPVVLYVNPQFAGDAFPARRRMQQRRVSGTAFISVDAQIMQTSTKAAAALSATLAGGGFFAGSVQNVLASSPLAGAQVVLSVEPYLGTNDGASATGVTSLAAAAGASAGIFMLVVAGGIFVYRAKRHHAAAVVPAAPEATDSLAPRLSAGQNWRSFNREFLTSVDMDFLVALGALDADGKRVGTVKMSAEVRTRFSPVVLDRLVSFGVLAAE